ncbi:superoxide dismutase [Deinococcus sp.]|uniref:superoxide dismutase n=1 Tax=Deinococcus sp. TaxID=47478 RepID=UPI003B5AA5E2
MKKTMMFGLGILLLSSCATMAGKEMKDGAMADGAMADKAGAPASYVLQRQPAADTKTADGLAANPVGNAEVTTTADTVSTTTKLTGMLPNTYYVAHFHVMGTDNNSGEADPNDPCKSNGDPILSSKMVAQSDAGGAVTLTGSVAKADVLKATYYNVHTSKDAEGTPADPGVACSAVTIK